MRKGVLSALGFTLMVLHADPGVALDSYRYLHVSIETPWMIFLFLLGAVFVPYLLMLALMWWRPMNKSISTPKSKTPNDE